MTDTSLHIDLSAHDDKYAATSQALVFDKKVNFLFGKNGTGKTTLTDEIASQFSTKYTVHVFKDFDGVAVNERLDAVALGTENANIQKKIDKVDDEIADILKEVESPVEKLENLYTKASKAAGNYNAQAAKIDRFHRETASHIKGINNPSIASPNYDKNLLKSEISKANTLTDEEVAAHKDTIRADKKPDVSAISLPRSQLSAYLESTNDIIGASVTKSSVIPELDGNPRKQQFAKDGMDIHSHDNDEVCAFCGNELTDERWTQLASYFNDEVKKLEGRIRSGINLIQAGLDTVDSLNDIDRHLYYGKYSDRVDAFNLSLQLRKSEYSAFLGSLLAALREKQNNLFTKTNLLELKVPDDFTALDVKHKDLVKDNNQFSKDLAVEQDKARDALRRNVIHQKLEEFKYVTENDTLSTLLGLSDSAQTALNEKTGELTQKREERAGYISQTKDEKRIAIQINKLLKSMGAASFELELVNDEQDDQKGQYQIIGHDGKSRRPVTALSKGEKNIIAFLYFMYDLNRAENSGIQKIIILDDPMTSNDDTMQYIMINEIQRFYRLIEEGNYFILLTHNVHFYLNIRPNTAVRYKVKVDGADQEISFYEKFGVWHLLSDGKRSTIKPIKKGKYDFRTSYETLWKELLFLYNADDATSDLMLGPCRKICETYMHFTKKELDAFYGENTSAKKLFDVNQHSIDDFEAELNGKTKPEIRDILKSLYLQNGAEDHFNSYWKEGSL